MNNKIVQSIIFIMTQNNPMPAVGFYSVASIFIFLGSYQQDDLAPYIGLGLVGIFWIFNAGLLISENLKGK